MSMVKKILLWLSYLYPNKWRGKARQLEDKVISMHVQGYRCRTSSAGVYADLRMRRRRENGNSGKLTWRRALFNTLDWGSKIKRIIERAVLKFRVFSGGLNSAGGLKPVWEVDPAFGGDGNQNHEDNSIMYFAIFLTQSSAGIAERCFSVAWGS